MVGKFISIKLFSKIENMNHVGSILPSMEQKHNYRAFPMSYAFIK